ncbi:hypothetical protein BC829DRAFT_387673 [Chytridium lagenaria]|nr:hypothetical protein BC829DRAFT_387673 [Chytridium lagenaria]
MVIGSLQLVTSNASVPSHMRGSVAGISSACGAIGILFTSKLGGWLFDNWFKGAPFMLLAIGHALGLIIGIVCWVMDKEGREMAKKKREERRERRGGAAQADVAVTRV